MNALRALLFFFCVSFAQSAFAYTLTVVTSPGVTGSPATSTHTYKAGAVIPYAYKPTAGYSAAVVIDGANVPRTGAIKMIRDRWIYAYGKPLKGTLFGKMITIPSDPTKFSIRSST